MERYEPYTSLGLALLAGLLIGLEREQSRPATEENRPFLGGIRTYPLIGLLGAVAVLLVPSLGPWPLVLVGTGLLVLLGVSYWRDAQAGHAGITTEVSALLTLLLGALSASQPVGPLTRRIFIVSAIAVAAAVLLSYKAQLRQLSRRVSNDDVIATLKFLLVAVVVLPVLPDEPLGPWGTLNPFRIGFMVTLIAGIGFVGYVAMRLLGPGRGLLVTGVVGGLASSTAVTLAAASRARQTPALAGLSALAAVVASTIMFARMLAVLFAVERSLMQALLVPLGGMALTGAVTVLVLYLRGSRERGAAPEVELKNPFELTSALKFGGLFMLVLLASRWAQDSFGAGGAYVTGVLAGLTNVDAISLSMANLVKAQQIELSVARNTVVLAACSNTVVKGGLALVLGGKAMGKVVALCFGAVLLVGLGLLWV